MLKMTIDCREQNCDYAKSSNTLFSLIETLYIKIKKTGDFIMENYSIGALVVIFLMTLFAELYLLKFEFFHTRTLEKKQR